MRIVPTEGTVEADDLLSLYLTPPGRRLVRVLFIASLDGAAEVAGTSEQLGGELDRQLIGTLRAICDGVLVGGGTLRQENYRAVRPLAARRAWRTANGRTEFPRLVVVSSALDLDPAQAAFANAPVRPVVITHAGADAARRRAIAEVADVLVRGDDQVDIAAALADLRSTYGLHHLLCEGGPTLFGTLHAAGLVDEVCLTISPVLAGSGAGRIIAGPAGALTQLTLKHALAADGYLFLRYTR
ncbi:MAG TPA: pyrimidine reductase family protein [Streptosporangiaceae bacterium]|jgi:riboflavin biosynthesis pyrimidine reductase